MSGPLDGKSMKWEIPTDGELILNIGRRPGCDIFIDYDTQVSRLHARLSYDSDKRAFFLEDLHSRNGTIVNDVRLAGRVPVKSGTLFRVGHTWLRLDVELAMPIYEDDTNDRYDLPF